MDLGAAEAGQLWMVSKRIDKQLEERDRIVAGAAAPPASGTGNRPPTQREKFWSVQNVLLVLGAVLLAGASIVFLVFSWGEMDLGIRTLVTGGFTVVLFVAAWITMKKGLQASAEAISGLAALTLYLDAWALHVTGLITLGDLPDYLAAASVVTGAVLIGIGLFMRLVTPRILGTALIPLGAAALAAGQPTALMATLVLTVGACLGLAMFHPRSDRMTVIALCISTALLFSGAVITAYSAWFVNGHGSGAASLSFISITLGLYAWCSPVLRRTLATSTAIVATTAGLGLGAWALSSLPVPVSTPPWDSAALPILGAILIPFLLHGISSIRTQSKERGLDPVALRAAIIVNVVFVVPSFSTAAVMLAFEPFPGSATDVRYTVQALGGIAAFTLGIGVLRVCKIGGQLAHNLAVVARVALITLLPVLTTSVFLTVGLWITVALSATVIIVVTNPRGATRQPLRALVWVPLLPAIALNLAVWSSDNGSGAASPRLLGILGITIGAIVFSLRSWEFYRQVPIEPVSQSPQRVKSMHSSGRTPPANGAPRAKFPRRYERLNPGEQAFLLSGSVISASLGLMTILGAQLPRVLGAVAIVELALLATSAAALGYVASTQRRISADIRALLASSTFFLVFLTPALAANPLIFSENWLKIVAIACSALVLLHPVILVFSARSRATTDDKARTYIAVLLPLAILLLVRTLTTLDAAGRVDWSLVALGALALLPALAGWTLPRAFGRRQALEYTTLIGSILVLLPMLTASRTLGLAFLIMAASAFLLATTHARGTFIWFGYGFTIISSWMLSATYGLNFVEVYTVPLALLLCALGQAMMRVGRSHLLLVAGFVVLTIPTVFRSWQTDYWRESAIVAVATLLALSLAITRFRGGGTEAKQWPLMCDLGLLSLAITILGPLTEAIRFSRDGDTPSAILWLLIAGSLTTLTCIALDAPGNRSNAKSPRVWGPFLVLTVLTIPTAVLIDNHTPAGVVGTSAVIVLVSAWGALALFGAPPGWPRVHSSEESAVRTTVPLLVALALAALLAHTSPLPGDALLTIAGLFIAVVTIRAAQVREKSSTWTNVSFGVIATVAPFSITMLAHPTGWRVTLAVVIASVWLLSGVKLQWQAPVVLGALALLGQVAVLAGPPALAAFAGLQSWVVLAIVGAVLLISGLMYERQVKRAKSAIKRLSDLR